MRKLLIFVFILNGLFLNLRAQNDSITGNDFGATEEKTFNFKGEIYYLPEGTAKLPDFKGLTPVGTIFTKRLNIKNQPFDKGFPGVTDRYEYFAIDYKGHFYLKEADTLCFILGSDDGSKLFIDDSLLINNDFGHGLQYIKGCRYFSKGMHSIEVQYYQGPRYYVALILHCRKQSEKTSTIFDLEEFFPITIEDDGDVIHIEISDEILFDYNSFKLSIEAQHALSEIKRLIFNKTKLKKIVISGHTDDTGSNESNMKLSKNRANSVKMFYIKLGVGQNLLSTKGYGENQPKFPNTSDENRQKNRRIEIEVIKM